MAEYDAQAQLDNAPIVSTHRMPQASPQEWDCGCITVVYVTDRDFLRGEEPFEMRLARPCESPKCERVRADQRGSDEQGTD